MAEHVFTGFAGARIAATLYGDDGAPAVLLLHGEVQTRADWAETAESLALAGRHVVAIDLRGHGDSDRPADGRYDLAAHAGDVRAVLAQLGSRPVIVGASLGGWAALEALGTDDAAFLATGLVLVDAQPRIGPENGCRVGDRQPATEQERLEWDRRMSAAIDPGALSSRILSCAERIQVPSLVIRGAAGGVGAPAHDLAGRLGDCETLDIPDAQRLPGGEHADTFNAALLDFLERRLPREPVEYRAGSDARTLRDALGCFATGVTIVTTTADDGTPVGLTANSFTSVSLEPPLLLVCIGRQASSLRFFEQAEPFAVNVLQIGQQLDSTRFAMRDPSRFEQARWEPGENGAPVLLDSLVAFECTRHELLDGGDHLILVGRVTRARFEPRRDPLLFFRGKYRRLHFS
jgi:flavin reductase (DIM6/NTAB) family NADH-FMN oxidoreductase RutF/pimeloyl-ACP methyl ester carboxylesterase